MDSSPASHSCTGISCVWLGRRGDQVKTAGQGEAPTSAAPGGSRFSSADRIAQEIAFLEGAEEKASDKDGVGSNPRFRLDLLRWHVQTSEQGVFSSWEPRITDTRELQSGKLQLALWLSAAAQTLQTEWPALRNHSGSLRRPHFDCVRLEQVERCSLPQAGTSRLRSSPPQAPYSLEPSSDGDTCACLGPNTVCDRSSDTCCERHSEPASDQAATGEGTLSKVEEFLCVSVKSDKNPGPGYTLPASFLLISGREVVGHARLQAAALPGCPAQYVAASYVIVEERVRGRGWGTLLMRMVEAIASQHWAADYVILRTRGAARFYEKLGYLGCSSMECSAPCLARLSSRQRDTLNASLGRLLQSVEEAPHGWSAHDDSDKIQYGSKVLTQEKHRRGSPQEEPKQQRTAHKSISPLDVWLRKRVGRCIETPVTLTWVERCTQVVSAMRSLSRWPGNTCGEGTGTPKPVEACVDPGACIPSEPSRTWGGAPASFTVENGSIVTLLDVPWCKQIGPACGISAICMAAAFFAAQSQPPAGNVEVGSQFGPNGNKCLDVEGLGDHLLALAKSWRISRDGELFNVRDFIRLAREGARLDAVHVIITQAEDADGRPLATELKNFHGEEAVWMPMNSADKVAYFLDKRWLLVLPFDSAGGHVVCQRGRKAHYGIVVGACRLTPEECPKGDDGVLLGKSEYGPASLLEGPASRSDDEQFGGPVSESLITNTNSEGRSEEMRGAERLDVTESFPCNDTETVGAENSSSLADVAIVLQHGRSRRLLTEWWTKVQESNAQLLSVDKRTYPDATGMQLMNSAILLRGIRKPLRAP
ncbi:gnat family protein [Cystoisospora suis]|uniref:Gnat family protein n=1 Tax=Cystoisospora suis TaxID=483139 RepID=A0A2C6LEK9_9APIC|nr:gnat family protein [Cystoisospora suis]